MGEEHNQEGTFRLTEVNATSSHEPDETFSAEDVLQPESDSEDAASALDPEKADQVEPADEPKKPKDNGNTLDIMVSHKNRFALICTSTSMRKCILFMEIEAKCLLCLVL